MPSKSDLQLILEKLDYEPGFRAREYNKCLAILIEDSKEIFGLGMALGRLMKDYNPTFANYKVDRLVDRTIIYWPEIIYVP